MPFLNKPNKQLGRFSFLPDRWVSAKFRTSPIFRQKIILSWSLSTFFLNFYWNLKFLKSLNFRKCCNLKIITLKSTTSFEMSRFFKWLRMALDRREALTDCKCVFSRSNLECKFWIWLSLSKYCKKDNGLTGFSQLKAHNYSLFSE